MRVCHLRKNASGFTLVELLIAILVTGLLMGAVFNVYLAQTRTEVVQNQLVDMQQNLRVGLEVMAKEIRPAGFDPMGMMGFGAGAGVATASPFVLQVTMDLDGDGVVGGVGEQVTFGFANAADGAVGALDGIADNGRDQLGLDIGDGAGRQPFIDSIQAVGFAYAIDADNNGQLDVINPALPNSNLIWAVDTDGNGLLETHLDTNDDGQINAADDTNGDGRITAADSALVLSVQLQQIRAVRVWLLARGDLADPRFSEPGAIYVVGDRQIPGNDGFRRRLATTTIKLRNM